MNFDGLIFDLDGTLWDCTENTTAAINRVYSARGLENRVSQHFIRSISGKTWSEFNDVLLNGIPAEQQEEVDQQLRSADVIAAQSQAIEALYPGVVEGLAKLFQHYSLFLVSNCGVEYLQGFFLGTGLGKYFKDSECYGRTGRPKAENIAELVARQNLKSPCYIGDTSGDEQSAAQAGIAFFHAAYGFGQPLGQPPRFESFARLVEYFLKA